MNVYLPSLTEAELFRYASVHTTTDLEKELLRRIVEAQNEERFVMRRAYEHKS